MPTFGFYSAWMDTAFYLWSLLFAFSLFALVYSMRRYLELKNSDFDEEDAAPVDVPGLLVSGQLPGEEEEVYAQAAGQLPADVVLAAPAEAPEPLQVSPAGLPVEDPPMENPDSPAENFVRGIYEGISGLDARLKDIEASLLKGRSNNEFAVKFLEDIAADIDSLDKTKIKARIEYLLSDLKK